MTNPSTILILRHAEKPKDKDNENLSNKGYERAAALAYYFPKKFPGTQYIFAAGIGAHSPSHRPLQTITPTAEKLNLEINHNFLKENYQDMVDYILSNDQYANAQIIICWEHTLIEGISKAFGTTNVPKDAWPGNRFDLVWELNYSGDNKYNLNQHPQKLMYKDKKSVID